MYFRPGRAKKVGFSALLHLIAWCVSSALAKLGGFLKNMFIGQKLANWCNSTGTCRFTFLDCAISHRTYCRSGRGHKGMQEIKEVIYEKLKAPPYLLYEFHTRNVVLQIHFLFLTFPLWFLGSLNLDGFLQGSRVPHTRRKKTSDQGKKCFQAGAWYDK